MFFERYARDIAQRLRLAPGAQVLEIAAGASIVTRKLLSRLPPDGRLTATDIGEPMLQMARAMVPADARVTWQIADACTLPFEPADLAARGLSSAYRSRPPLPSATRRNFPPSWPPLRTD